MTELIDLFEDSETLLETVPKGWEELWEQETKKPYWNDLMEFIKKEYNNPDREHQDIFPPEENVFRVFHLCRPDNIKAVILGQDPYHEKDQADGIAFSYSAKGKIPPSLKNIYKELWGESNNFVCNPDLSSWVEKGIFLLNCILTVKEGKALSHEGKGWENFTDAVIKFISEKRVQVCFMLWGKYAHSKKPLISETNYHNIVETSHPSPLSAKRKCGQAVPFLGSGCFDFLKVVYKIDIMNFDEI